MSNNTPNNNAPKYVALTTKNGEPTNFEHAMDADYIYLRVSRKLTPKKSSTGKSYVLAATAGVEIPGLGDSGGYFRGTVGLQLSKSEKKAAALEAARAKVAEMEAELGIK